MLNFFRRKEKGALPDDIIWVNTNAKYRAMRALLETDPSVVFIFWFDDSLDEAVSRIGGYHASRLIMARQSTQAGSGGTRSIFAEHYPLRAKENELYVKLGMQKPIVWSALDEPLLKKFGGERIMEMMQKLGMDEKEPVQNSLVGKSIARAQDKLARKVVYEQTSRSAGEWFAKNALS